jgi:hypothetical protein
MPHSPLTPEPVSPEYRGEGRYGFEGWVGSVFCLFALRAGVQYLYGNVERFARDFK